MAKYVKLPFTFLIFSFNETKQSKKIFLKRLFVFYGKITNNIFLIIYRKLIFRKKKEERRRMILVIFYLCFS